MPETPKQEISRRVRGYPESVGPFFKSAFALTASLPEDVRKRLFDGIISEFERGQRRIDGAEVATITGLTSSDADQAAAVYSLIIGLLAESNASPAEFVEASKGFIFDPEHEQTVLAIATAICSHRDQIAATIKLARLSGAVLPSFAQLEIAIDVRLSIVGGSVETAVPVAVVHLDTDADHQEAWFQMTIADVEKVTEKFTKALGDLKVAQAVGSKK